MRISESELDLDDIISDLHDDTVSQASSTQNAGGPTNHALRTKTKTAGQYGAAKNTTGSNYKGVSSKIDTGLGVHGNRLGINQKPSG